MYVPENRFPDKNHHVGLQGSSFATSHVISDETHVKAVQSYLTKVNPGVLKTGSFSVFAIVVWVLKLSEEASSLQHYTQMIVCGHCQLKAQASMHAGVNDYHICSVSGYEHLYSLKVYHRRPNRSGSRRHGQPLHFLGHTINNS